MKKTLLIIVLLSFGFSQRQEKNEIITERHDNGLKKLVLVFEGTGINETLIGRYGFYDTGVKHFVELYKNNKKHGKSIYWYKNGQKKEEVTYKNVKLDGLWTSWYKNGQKRIEGIYKDGKKDGIWTAWYDDGQKMSESTLRNDRMERSIYCMA